MLNPFVNPLPEYLKAEEPTFFPQAHASVQSYYDRYIQLERKFADYPAEMGAMKADIVEWREKVRQAIADAMSITDEVERAGKINEILADDSIIFLNIHGPQHTQKVQEKALEILRCFTDSYPTPYEVFFLLSSIVVHDVGNLYGRSGHEKKIASMLEKATQNIIADSLERRTIARIAGVHGGKINNSKDTISQLQQKATVNGFEIREQALAAVLRFADELADDATRANYPAMDAGILGNASEVYHVYSSKLHTVKLKENEAIDNTWDVMLRFEIDEETAKKQFQRKGDKVYLLDEIYDRTIKMENERRYCTRYLRPFCAIERIDVEIIIEHEDSVFDQERVQYTLEEKGYPDRPCEKIQEVDANILSGEQMAEKLERRAE